MDLTNVIKAGLGSLAGGQSGDAGLGAALGLLNGSGGLTGLVQAFQSKGLGDIVQSWVGTGQNMPISAEQIQSALGTQQLSQFASKAGVAPEAAGSMLAGLLPSVVDKLTPTGQLPADNEIPGLDMLKGLFK